MINPKKLSPYRVTGVTLLTYGGRRIEVDGFKSPIFDVPIKMAEEKIYQQFKTYNPSDPVVGAELRIRQVFSD